MVGIGFLGYPKIILPPNNKAPETVDVKGFVSIQVSENAWLSCNGFSQIHQLPSCFGAAMTLYQLARFVHPNFSLASKSEVGPIKPREQAGQAISQAFASYWKCPCCPEGFLGGANSIRTDSHPLDGRK